MISLNNYYREIPHSIDSPTIYTDVRTTKTQNVKPENLGEEFLGKYMQCTIQPCLSPFMSISQHQKICAQSFAATFSLVPRNPRQILNHKKCSNSSSSNKATFSRFVMLLSRTPKLRNVWRKMQMITRNRYSDNVNSRSTWMKSRRDSRCAHRSTILSYEPLSTQSVRLKWKQEFYFFQSTSSLHQWSLGLWGDSISEAKTIEYLSVFLPGFPNSKHFPAFSPVLSL